MTLSNKEAYACLKKHRKGSYDGVLFLYRDYENALQFCYPKYADWNRANTVVAINPRIDKTRKEFCFIVRPIVSYKPLYVQKDDANSKLMPGDSVTEQGKNPKWTRKAVLFCRLHADPEQSYFRNNIISVESEHAETLIGMYGTNHCLSPVIVQTSVGQEVWAAVIDNSCIVERIEKLKAINAETEARRQQMAQQGIDIEKCEYEPY